MYCSWILIFNPCRATIRPWQRRISFDQIHDTVKKSYLYKASLKNLALLKISTIFPMLSKVGFIGLNNINYLCFVKKGSDASFISIIFFTERKFLFYVYSDIRNYDRKRIFNRIIQKRHHNIYFWLRFGLANAINDY